MPELNPKQTIQIIPASQLAGVQDQKVLFVGQQLAAGTATSGDLTTDIGNDNSWNALFGRSSHMSGMIRQFKDLNKVVRVDAIGLDDAGAAVKGTAVFTITGPATEDGSLTFSLASDKNHAYEVDVLDTDTETAIGDALVALIAADLDAPFTSANVAGVVTATAENGGTLSNEYSIRVQGSVAGVGVALTAWSGGATDPTLTGIFDVIGNTRYQTIVWPSVYTITEVQDLLDARFNAENEILDGMAILTKQGTLSTIKTFANQNSQSIVIEANKSVALTDRDGGDIFEMDDIVSAEFAAYRALRMTEGAALSRFQTTVAPKDQFGGIAIASLPYFNADCPNLPIPLATDEWSQEDIAELNSNGVATIGPNRAFNGTILGQQVTTWLTDNAGNPDTSFKFLETVDTASVIREFFYENFRKRYAQTRLTNGDLIAGRDMVNEPSFRAFCGELYDSLAQDALVEAGTDAKKDFNDNLVIAISVSTGTITYSMAPLLVGQLRVLLGTMQINFSS